MTFDLRPSTKYQPMNQSQPAYQIRTEITPEDTNAIRHIVESTGYFRPDEVAIAVELAQERLHVGERSGYYFVFIDIGHQTIAYCCFGPIPCTVGSFDLYWIAVDNSFRRKGLGGILLSQTERMVDAMNGRKLYIETSSKARYMDTRAFYEAHGYLLASRLKDYYSLGDDKITYAKDIL